MRRGLGRSVGAGLHIFAVAFVAQFEKQQCDVLRAFGGNDRGKEEMGLLELPSAPPVCGHGSSAASQRGVGSAAGGLFGAGWWTMMVPSGFIIFK